MKLQEGKEKPLSNSCQMSQKPQTAAALSQWTSLSLAEFVSFIFLQPKKVEWGGQPSGPVAIAECVPGPLVCI